MKKILIAGLLFSMLPGGVLAESDYVVQSGDNLSIEVWREAELQRQVRVRPDGKISFPLIGTLKVSGMSIEEVQEEVASRLGKYIPDPSVMVGTEDLNGNTIYVIGQVNRPGGQIMNSDRDVMQALATAGGLATFASKNSIRILRRVDGKETAIPFRYGDVEDGSNLEMNIILKAGDVVVVP